MGNPCQSLAGPSPAPATRERNAVSALTASDINFLRGTPLPLTDPRRNSLQQPLEQHQPPLPLTTSQHQPLPTLPRADDRATQHQPSRHGPEQPESCNSHCNLHPDNLMKGLEPLPPPLPQQGLTAPAGKLSRVRARVELDAHHGVDTHFLKAPPLWRPHRTGGRRRGALQELLPPRVLPTLDLVEGVDDGLASRARAEGPGAPWMRFLHIYNSEESARR
mmetsp:Transcript_55581/g.136224  ORF Transcript_55581/g.136224 Transcript_55581/m.136224 type:complete len:220 (-) Transcript_55581:622-1281(-)